MMVFLYFEIFFLIFSLNNCEVLNVTSALNKELRGAFPANYFNSSCLSSDCPGLKCTSGNLQATLSALGECAKGRLCGMQLEPRPITPVRCSIDELLPGLPWSTMCETLPNVVYSNVIPCFTVISDHEVMMSLAALTFGGDVACNFTNTVSLPSATLQCKYTLKYSSLAVINEDDSVDIVQPQLEVTRINVQGFPFPGIPDYYMSMFKASLRDKLLSCGLAPALGDFYANLFQCALAVAQCKGR